MQNVFTIDADIKLKMLINEPTVVQNDDIRFIINVFDGGQPLSLDSATAVSLASVRLDRQTVVTPGTKIGTNTVQFDLGTEETKFPGRVEATAQFYDSEGRVSTISFSYRVVKDPTGYGYIPSEREQTLIETVLGDGPLVIQQAQDAANFANEQGQFAQTQADYAKSQGDYAKAQGDYAKSQAELIDEKASSEDLMQLDNKVNEHLADNVSQGEVHGLRVFNGKLEYFDGQQWQIVKLEEQRIYGVRIDKNNSNPETRVTYIRDAVGFTPMRGNDGNFQWGSWQEVFESFGIRPCVLKNKQVQYYLDPNDFTKKIDGSPANLTGTDGDVMIEFGKPLWWKWTDEGSTYTIEISDRKFDGAVKHAFEIEEGYNLVPYYALLLTQILFVILFKSTDSQTALGRGRVDGATGYASTGGTDKKGMFYGSTIDEQMKFLGIEDYWGNKYWWIDGLVTDSSRNLLIGKSKFNNNGNGYQSFASGVSSNTDGFIDSVQGDNDKGFIIKSGRGSGSTYYGDYGYLYSSRVANFGGHRSDGSSAGFANLRLYSPVSSSGENFGARLFCVSNGKIYIGAYLGTSVDGKLRSISGSSEPTSSKNIGTFRTEARANN